MMINILSSLSISSTLSISIGTERISLNPSTFAGIFVEYPHSQNVPTMTLVILRRNLPRSPNTQTQHVVSFSLSRNTKTTQSLGQTQTLTLLLQHHRLHIPQTVLVGCSLAQFTRTSHAASPSCTAAPPTSLDTFDLVLARHFSKVHFDLGISHG